MQGAGAGTGAFINSQDVMDVEKTVSPKMLRGAPNERPMKDCPVLRWRIAGGIIVDGNVCVAKPREERVIRVKLRASILSGLRLMTEKRENEVAEVAVCRIVSIIPRSWVEACNAMTHSSRVF